MMTTLLWLMAEAYPLDVGGYLLFVRDGVLRARFRQLGFGATLVINSSIVLALFLVGRAVGQVITREIGRASCRERVCLGV